MNKPLTRMPQGVPTQGNWVWDGTQWICDPCNPCDGFDNNGQFPFCPPPGFPPPGCPPWFGHGVNSPPWYPGANAGVSFGTVAPPNPVRGHFWWNGLTLFLFDGAAWVPIGGSGGGAGGGAVVSPIAPVSPVTGMEWFDGTTLWIWDGTKWVAVGFAGGGPGGVGYSVTTFGSPGNFNFTIPANATAVTTFKFHLQGAGGGGGGTPTGSTFSAQGGGGGEYKQVALIGAAAGAVVACVVGGPGTAGATTGKGGNGGASSLTIGATNANVIANGGFGGWGGPPSGTNNATEGTGGHAGVFTPGTSNMVQVLSVPGGDAHLPSPSDWADPGGDAFLGHGQPGYDNSVGWNDTTQARGFGAGGRGAFNAPSAGGPGVQGVVIIERVGG